jgi:DNA repair exonuclease SbcCD ATPase subunit
MILFKRVRYKNFLSTGDKFTEIILNRSPTTLVVGKNGCGKSTMLDAIAFGLFGKAHRDINKNQLINSINQKHCVVEVEFDVGPHQFKIVRGIKPNIFEIYQNNRMLNQNAAVKDYQKFLEQNILKLNHKSFHQIVVLGSSSFIPFMQLPAHHRREVIEDLLDINIFSKMNVVLKEKMSKIKDKLNGITYELDLIKEKVTLQKKYISDIAKLNDKHIGEKRTKINEAMSAITLLQQENDHMNKWFKTNDGIYEGLLDKSESEYAKALTTNGNQKSIIANLVKTTKFFEENHTCPTCSQDIDSKLRESKLNDSKKEAKKLQVEFTNTLDEIKSLTETISEYKKILNTALEWKSEIASNNKEITKHQVLIDELEKEILSVTDNSSDVVKAQAELNSLNETYEELLNAKSKALEDKTYLDAASEMLKDTGIKTKIISEYLPVMNSLINKHLQTMDFFVSFYLDENFNEIIKSRHRDTFNYASFSEGEKMKIDLSLMFAWRQIAKMKNSTATNLLILDETFDSSLDNDAIDSLLKIIHGLDRNTNTFIISHKGEQLDGKFRSKIEFVKNNNFSSILRP